MEVKYFAPVTLNETLKLLAEEPEKTKILAGGTDLVIALKEKRINPGCIVDISKLNGLCDISIGSKEIRIGAAVTFNRIAEDKFFRERVPLLVEAANSVGSPQIRNRGTLGGNIANASPAADLVPALLALDTTVIVNSDRGERTIKLEALLFKPGKTSLASDEMITQLRFEIPHHTTKSAFIKLGRRNALAISRMNIALIIEFIPNSMIVSNMRMALGALGPTAYLYQGADKVFVGQKIDENKVLEAIRLAAEDVSARLGNRSTAPYKKEAVKGILSEAFYQILKI